MKRFLTPIAGAAILAAGMAVTALPAAAGSHHGACSVIAKFDRDRDGKMNIFEAKRAGKALFNKLNPDGDGTLEYNEVAFFMSRATFNTWDKIKIKGLDRVEWARLIKHRFRAANPDGDRTIECDELMSPAGHRLLDVIHHR